MLLLAVREMHRRSRRSVGKYTLKPPRPEGEHLCNNSIVFSIIDILLALPVGFEPARQKCIASQKPNALPSELSGCVIIVIEVKQTVCTFQINILAGRKNQ